MRGRVLAQQKRWSEAERFLRAALELDSAYTPALETLAMLLIQCGRTEEAMPYLDQLEALDIRKVEAVRRWLSSQGDKEASATVVRGERTK